MSTRTVASEEEDSQIGVDLLRRWYHVPIIAVLMIFMLYVRLQNYSNVEMRDGNPSLSAVDSWYHWRTVTWTVENYPWTMPYDIYTTFPTGTYVGQFGTLFDQLIATAALIVGLGDPSTETIYTVAIVAVPVMAALVAIPVYLLGKRFGGRLGGLAAVAILALSPGTFLVRTLVGQLQHHVAEVLFMAIAVLAMAMALRTAEEELPIWEVVRDREVEAVRESALYSLLAGLALFLYLWTWPPGVVLIGIFALFFAIHLCVDFLRGVSPDHVAFVGAISMGTTGLLMTLKLETTTLSITDFGLLQPLLAFMTAIGCLFMAWLARVWDDRDIEPAYYPGAIVLIGVVGLAAMSVVLPDVYSTLINNLTGRLLPFDPAVTSLTIAEAQPPGDFTGQAFDEFGLGVAGMAAGVVILMVRPYFTDHSYRAEHTLFIVWATFLTSMAMTQVRFWYYFVLPVAIGNAILIGELARLIDLGADASMPDFEQIEAYQIIAIVIVVMMLFVPLVPPLAETSAMDMSEAAQPSTDAMSWEASNHWLANNTPEPGNYGGAGNADEIDYMGSYSAPSDGNYEYPDGTYGVMAWWDYGHLITTQAQRIPHANPFQHNARSASAFFTATSEDRAELLMDAIATGEEVDEQSNEELEQIIADGDSDEPLRYVMIDTATATNKFPAISEWTGPDLEYYYNPADYEPTETITEDEVHQRFAQTPYDDTMVSQLYFDDASGLDHYRLVHENPGQQLPIVSFALLEGGQVITGEDGEPAVEMNRILTPGVQDLIQQFDQDPQVDVEILSLTEEAPVKTYERVEGATVTGSVDPETVDEDDAVLVQGAVESNLDNETLSYTNEGEIDADGNFEVTVPYASDNNLTVEDGYTDTSVQLEEGLTVGVGTPATEFDGTEQVTFADWFEGEFHVGETDVPETAVVHGEEVPVDVELLGIEE